MLVLQTRNVYSTNNTNNKVKAMSVWFVKLNELFYENVGSN